MGCSCALLALPALLCVPLRTFRFLCLLCLLCLLCYAFRRAFRLLCLHCLLAYAWLVGFVVGSYIVMECLCCALPCPALPCPALPCSALPCPALPCPTCTKVAYTTRDTNTDGMIDFMGLGVATSRLGRLSRLICTHRHVSGFKLCLHAQMRVAAMCAYP